MLVGKFNHLPGKIVKTERDITLCKELFGQKFNIVLPKGLELVIDSLYLGEDDNFYRIFATSETIDKIEEITGTILEQPERSILLTLIRDTMFTDGDFDHNEQDPVYSAYKELNAIKITVD